MTDKQLNIIFSDGVIVRNHNRRIVIRRHKRSRSSVVLEMYSVNKDKGANNSTKHVLSSERLGRKVTIMGLSFDAIRDISDAIALYHEHIESLNEGILDV